jgi:tetratricopeptide (TPR) repeat protein
MLVEFLALNGQRQQAKDLALSLLDEKPYTHSAAIEAERALAAVGMQEKSRRALERWLEENPEAFFWPRREFQVVWRLAGAYEAAGMPNREEDLWKWFIGLPEDQTLQWVRGRAMSNLAQLYVKQARVAPAAEMIRRRAALPLKDIQFGQNASAKLLSLFETPLIF